MGTKKKTPKSKQRNRHPGEVGERILNEMYDVNETVTLRQLEERTKLTYNSLQKGMQTLVRDNHVKVKLKGWQRYFTLSIEAAQKIRTERNNAAVERVKGHNTAAATTNPPPVAAAKNTTQIIGGICDDAIYEPEPTGVPETTGSGETLVDPITKTESVG